MVGKKTHKRQHFIPKSYLKNWADETLPQKKGGYIWLFEKKGTYKRRMSPNNTWRIQLASATLKVKER